MPGVTRLNLICWLAWLTFTNTIDTTTVSTATVEPALDSLDSQSGCTYAGPYVIPHGTVLVRRTQEEQTVISDALSARSDDGVLLLHHHDDVIYVCDEDFQIAHTSNKQYRLTCFWLPGGSYGFYYLGGLPNRHKQIKCVRNGAFNTDTSYSAELPFMSGSCNLPKIENGYVADRHSMQTFPFGARLNIRCNTSYHFQGVDPNVILMSVKCDSRTSSWITDDGMQIHCANSCQLPAKRSFIDYNVTGHVSLGEVPPGSLITYFCKNGYRFQNASLGTLVSSTCHSGIGWSLPPPRCVAACDPAPSIEHGNVVLHNRRGERFYYEYSCNFGYRLKGFSSYKCSLGNKWSPEIVPPLCTKNWQTTTEAMTSHTLAGVVKCSPLEDPAHGYYEPSKLHYYSADKVTLTCELGYTVLGDKEQWCLPVDAGYTGIWSGDSETTCILQSNCSRPTTIDHGWHITGTDQHGHEVVQYFCSDGYDLVGQQARSCFSDHWSGPEPYCQRSSYSWFSSNVINKTLVISITTSVVILLFFVIIMSAVQRRCGRALRRSIYPPRHRRCLPLSDDIEDDVSTLMAIQGCPPSYTDAMDNPICPPDEVPSYAQAVGAESLPMNFDPESPAPSYEDVVCHVPSSGDPNPSCNSNEDEPLLVV